MAAIVHIAEAMHAFLFNPSKAEAACRCVLIGEANSALREHLLAVLRTAGLEAVAMASGVDLLDALAVSLHPELGSGRFDLVICEARLLGDEEARVVNNLRKRDKIPPFVLTAVIGDQGVKAKANQLGALAILDKPLDIDHFCVTVNTVLRLGEDPGGLARAPLPAKHAHHGL